MIAGEAEITSSSVGGTISAVKIGRGLLLSDTLLATYTGLRIEGGHVICRDSRIVGGLDGYYGVEVVGSDSLTLRNTYVSLFDAGVYVSGDAFADIDSGCVLTGNDSGLEVYNSDVPVVRNSTFSSNTTNGIYCHDGASITIEGNAIGSNGLGVFCYWSSPAIRDENIIEGNVTGVRCDMYASPGIYRNKIAGSTNGVLASNDSEPHLGGACEAECDSTCTGGNKFVNNTYHVSVQSQVTVMAECNWWGTTKAPPAAKFIGSVDYDPWLTSDPLPNLSAGVPEDTTGGGDTERKQEVPVKPVLPVVYDIAQNAPNPFNPTTTIRYQVPPPGGSLRIVLYDVRGARVATLIDRHMPPGFYALTWDGRDQRGVEASSGVYFVRMEAPGFTRTRKLVLLK